jgi:propanediol dehydratase large subunit
VQSETINVEGATVKVTSDGADMPVTKAVLQQNVGSRYAIRFNPMGWTSQAGKKYQVVLSGTSMPIEHEVEFADCK